jgi:hypothetical protein
MRYRWFGLVLLAACATDFSTPNGVDGGDADASTSDGGNQAVDGGVNALDGAACDGASLTSDSNNCGTCGHTCSVGQFCSAATCVPGCAGAIIYVSNGGNDANDGCTLQTAKKTISAAIGYAASLRALGHSIHVCHGTYAEGPLTLNYPVDILGGYDCTSGARTSVAGGVFDPNLATSITFGSSVVTNAPVTLDIELPSTTPGAAPVNIDGVAIEGASKTACKGSACATQGGAAIHAGGGAPVKISNVAVNSNASGGDTTTGPAATSNVGSAGIWVTDFTPVEIATSNVSGGSGSNGNARADSAGSVGIYVNATGAITVHDSVINGGSGTSSTSASAATGAVGVLAVSSSLVSITNNTITGGTGTAVLGASGVYPNIGVFFWKAAGAATLTNNTVSAGTGTCSGTSGNCATAAVFVSQSTGVKITRNRIYGGDTIGPGIDSAYGVYITASPNADVSNNMINPGGEAGVHTSVDVELVASANPVIAYNTMQLGAFSTVSYGLSISSGPPVTGIVFENNLLFSGSLTNAEHGVYVPDCNDIFASFVNNAFVAVASTGAAPLVDSTGVCSDAGPKAFDSVSSFVGRLEAQDGGTELGNDFAITQTCFPDDTEAGACSQSCPVTLAACVTQTLAVPGTLKTQPLVAAGGAGFLLKPSADCRIKQGGLDLSAQYPTDLYGATRPAAPSLGADQIADAGCP